MSVFQDLLIRYPLRLTRDTFNTICGIYGIFCIENEKWYIGQAKNLYARSVSHANHLRANTHKNYHLQAAFNKYGYDKFFTYILQRCKECELNILEKKYIDLFNSHDKLYGYNIQYFDDYGNPTYNETFKGRCLKNIKHRKITINDVKVIRELYMEGYSSGFISKKYHLNISHVSDIITNKVWFDPLYKKPNLCDRNLTFEQRATLDTYLHSGVSPVKISSEIGISWKKVSDYFKKINSRLISIRTTVLNTETGIFYESIKAASDSTEHISCSKLYQWLSKFPSRNKSSFVLCGKHYNDKPKKDIVILDKNTGVFYLSLSRCCKNCKHYPTNNDSLVN